MWLETNLAENLKLTGIIILQIKAILVKERAKFEVAESLPGQLDLANAVVLQIKPREIRVNTSNEGSGENYESPCKIDYHNPIETINYWGSSNYNMRFFTRFGD